MLHADMINSKGRQSSQRKRSAIKLDALVLDGALYDSN